MSYDDFDTDSDDDWDDYPDDTDEFAPSVTIPCWKCGEEVYEDAVQCTRCGQYDPGKGRRHPPRPMWFWVLGLLGILAVIGTILLGTLVGF